MNSVRKRIQRELRGEQDPKSDEAAFTRWLYKRQIPQSKHSEYATFFTWTLENVQGDEELELLWAQFLVERKD